MCAAYAEKYGKIWKQWIKNNIWLHVLEEYDKLNAVQSPMDDTEKDKHKSNKVNSILLQKIEDKNGWKRSKNGERPTYNAILSVISTLLLIQC